MIGCIIVNRPGVAGAIKQNCEQSFVKISCCLYNQVAEVEQALRSMNPRPNIPSYPVCIEDRGGNGGKLGFG